jgi:type II secretory pathway component PulK
MRNRKASILVVILVCFVVVAIIFTLMVKSAASEHRRMETQQWAEQAKWLAEAALERAASRLAADAKYAGETWTIPAEELDGESGVARIRVEAAGDSPGRKTIGVEADYPDDPQHRSRCVRQIEIPN